LSAFIFPAGLEILKIHTEQGDALYHIANEFGKFAFSSIIIEELIKMELVRCRNKNYPENNDVQTFRRRK
jgi:hypothetical protein